MENSSVHGQKLILIWLCSHDQISWDTANMAIDILKKSNHMLNLVSVCHSLVDKGRKINNCTDEQNN